MDSRATPPPDLVVVCQLFHPELVSTGQTLTELVEELSGLGRRITVIASQPTVMPGSPRVPAWIEHRGVTIRRTWSTRLPKKRFWGKLINQATYFISATWTVLTQYRTQPLLLLTNPPYLPLLGWMFNVLRGQPFHVVLFDIMPEQAESIGFLKPGGWIARIWRRFNRLWYLRAASAVVLSRDMLEGALKNANLTGTPEEAAAREKTRIIHVWADDRLITPLAKEASPETVRLGVADKFVIQYSGNHGRFHDIETLVGLAAAFGPGEGVVFQFIGEGQKKRLVSERFPGAAHPQVYESSYVPKEILRESLAMADMGVVAQLPGQEFVCFPSKLLGVMAAGRATLAVCPPGCELARMIRDFDIGIVVPNGDIAGGQRALREIAAQPDRVRQMGENAARVLRERFTLAQAARGYFEILK